MADRVTQVAIEVLVQSTGLKARTTQVAVEALENSSTSKARVTQVAAEVLENSGTSKARVTQVAIEVLRAVHLVTATFTADAWFRAPRSGSVNADAVLKKNITSTKSADAVLAKRQSGSYTTDAAIVGLDHTFTANAVLFRVHANTFLADAAIGYRSATLDAVIKKTGISQSFIASAVISAHYFTFTANALIAYHFKADAFIKKVVTGSFTANAVIQLGFKANAVIKSSTTKSFTADARFLAHSFTANAVIAYAGAPGEPGGPPPLVIMVNGQNVTDAVIIRTATFTQAINARPGEFSMEIKDKGHIYNFVSGGRVTFDIDGHRMFDGYIAQATMRYAFPVDVTTDPSLTARIWKLQGPDLNILFTKRLVFDQINPNAQLPIYSAGTSDRSIILDFVENYLDLRNDNITTDGVKSVGSPNPDSDGYIINIGSPWGAMMSAVAQLPGAVWGLTEDRDLFYEDDDTENAPFRLSDTPNNVTTFGYSNFAWTDDGTRLVNDAQVWGAGTGSSGKPVYAEVEDFPSQADHGRWQLPGQFRGDMFRQATVEHAAESIVYGSAQNLHGGKDPYVLIKCRVVKHGLRAGHKVRIFNNVFDMDEVVPIRRLTVSFVTKNDIFYDLELTREIDEPWFFAEFAGYPPFPPFHFPPFPPFPPPVQPPGPGCDDTVCGITDTFDRLFSPSSWGVSDAGPLWADVSQGYGVIGRDGTRGWLMSVRGGTGAAELDTFVHSSSIDVRFTFEVSVIAPMPLDWLVFDINGAFVRIDYGSGNHVYPGTGSELCIGERNTGNIDAIKHSYSAGVVYQVHLTSVGSVISASVWEDGTTEPSTPQISIPSSLGMQDIKPKFEAFSTNPPAGNDHGVPSTNPADFPSADGPTVYIDNFNIFGFNRCGSSQFENFNRDVAGGWGTATPGNVPWTVVSSSSAFSVTGATGNMTFSSTTPVIQAVNIGQLAFPSWTMHTAFQVADVDTWSTQLTVSGPGGDIDLSLTFDVAGSLDLNAQTTPVSFEVAKWYHLALAWDSATGDIAAKVYEDGTADPGWMLTDNYGLGFAAFSDLSIAGFPSSGIARQIKFDYIDFDYPGKPCYLDCPAIDYTVYPITGWDVAPIIGCAVSPGVSANQRNCVSNGSPDPLSTMRLYGGATYQVSYVVNHSYDSQALYPSLYSPFTSVFASVATGAASECWLWPVPAAVPPLTHVKTTFTMFTTADVYAFLNSAMCCCGTNYGSSMTAQVEYLYGPDPRFEGLPANPCVPISSATGQPAPAPGAQGDQNAIRDSSTVYHTWVAYVPGSLTVWLNGRLMRPGLDYTESDPSTGELTFIMSVDDTDIVYVTYIAAGAA